MLSNIGEESGRGRANKTSLNYLCGGGKGHGEGEERDSRATFAPCHGEAGDTLYQKHDRMIRAAAGKHG